MAMTPEQEAILREIEAKMREEQIAKMPKGLPGLEVIEPAVVLGTAAAGQVASGLAGLATTGYGLLMGEGEDAAARGARTVGQVQEALQYTPRTQYGARGMQRLQEATEPVLGPISRKFEEQSQRLGDVTLEATGSPLAAAAAYTLPTAALELAAYKLFRGARPQTAFFDAEGRPTQELMTALNEMGLSYEDLVTEAYRELPTVARKDIAGAPAIAESLQATQREQITGGGREAALAPLMVESGAVRQDPLAQQAVEAWQRPGVVQAVKQANPATRAKMLSMLNMRRRIGQNEALAARMRPTDITGQSMMERVNYLQDVLNLNNKRLLEIEQKNLSGKPVQTAPVMQAYTESLDRLDIKLLDDNTLSFEGSQIAENPGAQKTIMSLHRLLSEDVPIDALRFHKLKRQLDEIIDYGKAQQELTGTGKDVLSRVRAALNNEIRRVDNDYAQVNDVISDLLGSFDRLQAVAGRRTDLTQEGAATRLGQEARKVFSNYNVRGELIEAIDQIDAAAVKYGGKFDDNVMDLAMFATALDQRFGPVAATSLEGVMDSTRRRQELAENVLSTVLETSTGGTAGAMANVGRRMARMVKAREMTDEDAYRLMEELLRRGG